MEVVNRTLSSLINQVKFFVNIESLSTLKILTINDYVIQWLDPDGTSRDIDLPAEGLSINLIFMILNTGTTEAKTLIVRNDAATTIATLLPGMTGVFSCDGTDWKWENNCGLYYDVVSDKHFSGATATLYPATAGAEEGFYFANGNLVIERDDDQTPQIKVKSNRTDYVGLLTFKDQGDDQQWLIRIFASDHATNAREFTIVEQHQGSSWYRPLTIMPETPTDSLIIGKGSFKIGLPLVFNQTPQTLTGAGAVDVTSSITLLVTNAANALTLADGSEGQEKFIVMKTNGGTGTLTPTNLKNGSTLTFDSVGDSAHLVFIDGAWVFMGGTSTLGA